MYEIKKQLAWSKLKIGIVISIALLTLLLTVVFTGDIADIISPKELIKIHIRYAAGLRTGAPVWFAGIEVGAVKSIGFSPQYGIIVTISVNRDVMGYLKKDSRATVQTMGLLGDKYVELSSGSATAPTLRRGEMLEGDAEASAQHMVATGEELLKKMDDVVSQIGTLIKTVGEGQGTVAQLLKDPALYNNLKEASQRISAMIAAMQSGKGTAGKLINDDLFYNRLLAASESMERFGSKLDKEQGTLHRLIEDPQVYENLAQASARLQAILQGIEKGEGTAGKLVRDEELAQELKDAIKELKELTSDIRKNPKKYFKFSVF
jgi:phospholipid/cholesterol/gamma-HCH transport system substrate-binding protein